MTVLVDLNGSRPAFGPSSERDILLQIIDSILPLGELHWLEVGAGDGKNLIFLLERLCSERRIQALAVDPDIRLTSLRNNQFAIDCEKARIEEFALKNSAFDFVHARHSAYYFNEPAMLIRELIASLKPSGVLCLTIWSERCLLYKLHTAICMAIGASLKEILTKDRIFEISQALDLPAHAHSSENSYDADLLLSVPAVGLSLVRLAARKLPLESLPEARQLRILQDIVQSDTDKVRGNYTIVIRR